MIYFDNSATTRISDEALDSYNLVSKDFFGNPSSLHNLGEKSAALLRQAREQIASEIGAKQTEIFFTSGGTEGDNWAIKGGALSKKKFGKHLITTQIEHPAIQNSMQQLEDLGFSVTYLPVNADAVIDVADALAAITDETTLISVMYVNNEVGSVQPIKVLNEALKAYPNILLHVDAVQAVGKVPIDLQTLDRVDMMTFSSHKFHGPRGEGFLFKRDGKRISTLMSGGGQETGQRSGTENTPAIVAMAKALRIALEDPGKKQAHLRQLTDYLRQHLQEMDKVVIFTPEESAPHILCFGIKGIRGEVLVHALEADDIYVSTTSACSSRSQAMSSTLLAMHVAADIATSAIRVSLTPYNTMEEMKTFVTSFMKIYAHFANII